MVSPYPDLYRRFNNVDNIVKANKSQFVYGLFTKYPRDYIDIETHSKLDRIKPWIEKSSEIRRIQKISPPSQSQALQPQIVDRILILCVDFDDRPAQISTQTIYDRFFSSIGKSFINYYREVSYNQYIPEGEVHGWFRAPHNTTWYTSDNYGWGTYPFDVRRLVEDVIDIASTDPNINWSSFDNNGNGYLDSIIIIHSGAEAAATGNIDDFWAHVWSIVFPKIIQGKTIDTYALSAEYIAPTFMDQVIGVDCHEFGHLLGLEDLYDYSGNSNGIGDYSLMGSGSWTDMGTTPTHLDAWSKYQLGYVIPTENPVGLTYIRETETNSENIKYTTIDPKEYFMVENRHQKLFDYYLPAYGLLIWHINENQTRNDNELCFKVGLIQADGRRDLENKINYGDGADSFPGWFNNRSFGTTTNPGSILCDGTAKDMLIDNISDSADTMSFNSILPVPTGSLKFVVYPPSSEIYFDSIFQGITDNITGILIIDNIPIGTINYTVKKTEYSNRTGFVDVIEGTMTIVSIILSAISISGSLYITSNPSGATIYIDDLQTQYTTPVTIPGLTPGNHTYKLTLIGYQDKTGLFTIISGQTTNIDTGNLTQMPTTGSLYITSSPIGAKIYIDNMDTGLFTPDSKTDLTSGNHTYKLTLTGYYDKTGSFTINIGQITTVDVGNLDPIPTTGSLYITSSPIGAKIYIDNIDTGYTTPATISDILSGNYTYKLTLIGYQDKTDLFTIISGQTTNIDAGQLQLQVAQAGVGSPAGVMLMFGLLVGSIYSSMKKPELSKVNQN